MKHRAIENVLLRAKDSKCDSDFTYFFSLLLASETLTKTITLAIVSAIADDTNRNRYRLEHQLVRADGLGDWGRVIEDALTGPASQFLLAEARQEQIEITRPCKQGEWQHDATNYLKKALNHLGINSEEVPVKTDLKRWFRLFTTLRNKTRGHGATHSGKTALAAEYLLESIRTIYTNSCIFNRPWAHLHRNLSGKYRISAISENISDFEFLKSSQNYQYANGTYIFIGGPRLINLLQTDADLQDFFYVNGNLKTKKFELLSYFSDDKKDGDASPYMTPPGNLPSSETEGHGELIPQGKCFSNAPDLFREYVSRPTLESELNHLINDDKWPIITLVGRGGIGKTSLVLKTIQELYTNSRYDVIVWLSSRDVDLQLSGPKPVHPTVLSAKDMSIFYASLVLSPEQANAKKFDAQLFFEQQLQKCDLGQCLFIFDNFETTQNPIEMFNWIATFIKPPNKAVITTRLREFNGDFRLEVHGMTDTESKQLINQTAESLRISNYINETYTNELIAKSEGHPYVIKVLLGEVAKTKKASNIPHLLAGTNDILTALFERTYAALTPCSQRAFLTLAAWNSPVPMLALRAVLYRSTEERNEVEKGIESLLQYSMAEIVNATSDNQDFIFLPLVTSTFGKKKLNISPSKASIMADVETLQMLGPSRRDDIHLSLARRLEKLIENISRKIELGANYDEYSPILETICRSYNTGWLLLARWHMEARTPKSYKQAKDELNRFLENTPPSNDAAEAWKLLAYACYQTCDPLGEVHALIERSQISDLPFYDLSNTANRLNLFLRDHGFHIENDLKRDLMQRILSVMVTRKDEATADDFSRMAWLSIHSGNELMARDYVQDGLKLDTENHHLINLAVRLDIR